MDTSKPPHQVLERYWFTRGSGGDNLSLDQKLRRLHLRLCKIDNLRNTICYVRQSSAEDPHFLVFSVNLDSRPVELVLEGCSILVFCQNPSCQILRLSLGGLTENSLEETQLSVS